MTLHRMQRRRPAPLTLAIRQNDDDLEDGENTPDTPDSPDQSSSFSFSFISPTSASSIETVATTDAPSITTDASSMSTSVSDRIEFSDGTTTMDFVVVPASSATGAAATSLPDNEFSSQPSDAPFVSNGHGSITLSPVAIGLLVTFTVLGGVALFVVALFCMRRKKRRQAAERGTVNSMKDLPPMGGVASNTDLERSSGIALMKVLPSHPPSEQQKGDFYGGGRTSTATTVVDDSNPFTDPAIHLAKPLPATLPTSPKAGSHPPAAPLKPANMNPIKPKFKGITDTIPPTPTSVNPFMDPEREKAYDLLRDRPRSTTLTDAGDWRKNPFMDPKDERYDPFGQLRERAKEERKKYVDLLKKERERRMEGQ